MNTRTLLLCYSLIVFIGGIIGFIKAHSIASLVSGCSFASLILTSSILLKQYEEFGKKMALTLAAFLALFFAYRFFTSLTFFPSGIMSLISLSVFLIVLKNKKKSQLKLS